ncbi:hypothetical protein KHA80_13220 [Anaerobacillus sp. HL2]|nr:hypothetical protein KHA80_13220 [Anaerobacillus sp. HL2]
MTEEFIMKINFREYDFVGIDLHKEMHCAVLDGLSFGRVGLTSLNQNLPKEFEKFLKAVLKKVLNRQSDLWFGGLSFLMEER